MLQSANFSFVSRWRGACALLLVAGVGLASVGARAAEVADVTYTLGATAGAMQPLLGINAGPLHWGRGTADVMDGFRQIGVRQVRTHDFPGPLDMSIMYPDRSKAPSLQSSYNFTRVANGKLFSPADYTSDQAIAAIKDNGQTVYLRIWDSAGNMGSPSEGERANWVQAAVNVIRHYQDGQWNGTTGLIASVEVGNEPDSTSFWSYTKEEFYKLYADTAKAIRAVYPSMKIGGPGLTQAGWRVGSGQAWTRNFLDYVKANSAPLDFLSWHTYSTKPEEFQSAMAFYRSELDKRGYTNTELHLTEFGTAIGPIDTTSATDGEEFRIRARAGAINTATWIAMQQAGLKQLYFYRANNPTVADKQLNGMFDTDGLPTKNALVFAFWSEMAAYTDRIDPVASITNPNLKALAATRTDGQIAILVSNIGTSQASWAPTFADTRTLADFAVSLRVVDDSSALPGSATVPVSGVIPISAGTTQLLTLHSKTQAFAASAIRYGATGKQLLGVTMQSDAADTGKTKSVYLAAQFGNSVYANRAGTWQAYTGGDFPAYSAGALPAALSVGLVPLATDLRALAGAKFYLGYGSDATEMLTAGRYRLVTTIGQ